ncbi:alpha/beta fold hydrolase [Candidatus Chloroploca sp. M-50]|uniref:Alpha/beta fold hydrolase n=1 Tax=Candidatus Chloroploca mongolica TaxID=2528176 RepID=A0ABS4DEP7_9CHLR|nr:alpha/beta fold hydrolase [Candidatus Chloroploca mongolica]MBP1467907.1 alpha/beta fold hydrolase [Candidatus Chloroploca mongolica]
MLHAVTRLRPLLLVLILALTLAACADEPELVSVAPTSAPAAPINGSTATPLPAVPEPPAENLADYAAYLEETDCTELLELLDLELDLDELGVSCGYLIAPEDRSAPEGAEVSLALAMIPSRSATPRPDPIIYLDGGPGGSALFGIADWIDSPLRDEYEIILFDQRGTGLSWPSLNCIEMEEAEDDEATFAAAEACRDRLADEEVNLNVYNSAANAADVADLIAQLGYDEVNLLGISYGTRLAMAVLRDNFAGVRSVILDSPYPPNVNAYNEQALNAGLAIQAMLRGCASDPECADAFPDLEERFYSLIDLLDEEPILFEVEDEEGELVEAEVSGADLVNHISDWLYITDLISYVPLMIDELDRGETAALSFLYEESGTGFGRQGAAEGDLSDSEAMFYAVECREEAPFSTMNQARAQAADLPPQLDEALLGSVENFFELCPIWDVASATARERAPVESAVPTLILAGEYDPVTPPSWGLIAALGLSNSYFYVLPGGGHAVIDASDCMMTISKAFLDNPTREPDARCLDDLTPFFAYELP